jgi:hypothetical protein
MRYRPALLVTAIAIYFLCPVTGASSQDDELPCDVFARNADGSWTATRAAFIPAANFSVRANGVFRRGEKFKDYDPAAKLDEACHNANAAPPAPSVQTQQPHIALSKFADANGNIDIQRLSCGDLADSANGDAELFLAWYSGSYERPAKARTVNMARLRYAIRATVDYCKANRDKSLVKATELMMK